MLRRMYKKAQGATEYAIFIAAVLAGLLALQVYYKRAVAGNVRERADSIGTQFDQNGAYIKETRSTSANIDQTGANTAGGWSVNEVATNTGASGSGTINATGMSFNTLQTAMQANVNAGGGGKLTGNYAGAQVSTEDYVSNFGTTARAIGTHGSANMTDLTAGNRTVWQDSKLE